MGLRQSSVDRIRGRARMDVKCCETSSLLLLVRRRDLVLRRRDDLLLRLDLRVITGQVAVVRPSIETSLIRIVVVTATTSVAAAAVGLATLGEGTAVGTARRGLPSLRVETIDGFADAAKGKDNLVSC